MVSWIGAQSHVKSFAETKLLLAAHRLAQALRSWSRFSKEEVFQRVRRFAQANCAREGVYLGAHLLVDKEPLDPLSISPDEYESFLTTVETISPSVQFIFMVRSPEAVVSSIVNRKWGYSLRRQGAEERTVEEGITSWRAVNQFVSTIASKNNAYLCEFERLVEHPGEESAEIAQFLGLKNWGRFQPRETSEIVLDESDRQRVWKETRDIRNKLEDVGISYVPSDRFIVE
jgi:hypothetical protein